MRYLVTGASGFIGAHLVERLGSDGHQVTAWCRKPSDLWPGLDIKRENVDVCDAGAVQRAFASGDFDVVFHLAAQSLPTRSWKQPTETFRVNVDGTVNLLEAIRQGGKKQCRVLVAGSSGGYASNPDGVPIGEDAHLDPSSPYAVSKIASDQLAALYAKAYDLDIVRFMPFFWIGTLKTGDVASDLARRIVAIERGALPRLLVGRTDTVRDIIDVSDGVAALLLLVEKGASATVYNICRGEGVTIGELIEAFRACAKTEIPVELDPSLMRPVDELVRIGDPTRLRALGWQPVVPLADSVDHILDYWRGQPS